MPNLWTKATQKIAEAFSGPRTKDTEFDIKVEEMKAIEKGVISLRLVFQNFLNYTIGIRNLCKDVTASIKNVFDKNSPYFILSNDISEAHIELEKFYTDFYNNVNKLNSRTSEWPVLFSQAKAQIEKREESRKTYDHYDEKMVKIYTNKQEKSKKNMVETAKDLEFLQRNELKFKQSTEEYVKLSESTYETIHTILEKRYDLINPVISEFLELERIFFSCSNNIFRKFEGIESKFKSISTRIEKKTITYDPCKYIRGGEIIQKEKTRGKSPMLGNRNSIDNRAYDDEQNRIRSKSNIPFRQVNDQGNNKGNDQLNNKGNNIEDSKNSLPSFSDLNIGNNNFNYFQNAPPSRGSNLLYQEFEGIDDNFSGENRKRAATINHNNFNNYENAKRSSYVNNMSNDNNINHNNINSNTTSNNNNYNNITNNNLKYSNFNNNNNNNYNNFQYNNNFSNAENDFFNNGNNFGNNIQNNNNNLNNRNSNNTNKYISQTNNNNNNFDFDNIFSNNTNNNFSNLINPINIATSIPPNMVYGVVKGIPKAVNTLNNLNANFNLDVNNNYKNNNKNENNNPKRTFGGDNFKDLF